MASLEIRKLLDSLKPHDDDSLALTEFADTRNVSNCWICQQMPTSSTAPMLVPVPFTAADWGVMGWSELSNRFTSEDEDCYSPITHQGR